MAAPALGKHDNVKPFDLASCRAAAGQARLAEWVDAYLVAGPWANRGLQEGLRKHPRHWLGPVRVALTRLTRCCGPEPGMEFPVPPHAWEKRTSSYATSFTEVEKLPPLIVEWRCGMLSVRDGNHRLGAIQRLGWTHCWVVVWCNSASDFEDARTALDIA